MGGMRELDPQMDFRDDGGTPAWRANQATWRNPVVINARPPGFLRRLISVPFWRLAIFTLFWAGIAPLLFLVVALLILGFGDITGSVANWTIAGLVLAYVWLFVGSLMSMVDNHFRIGR